jgi:hypothetical protein
MTMHTCIRLLPCFALLSLSAFADVERTTKSCSVELKTIPQESGPVMVNATSATGGELETVSISYLGHTINLPIEALRDLKNVDIDKGSVRGTADIENPSRPRLQIAFNCYDPDYTKRVYPPERRIPVTLEFIVDPHHPDRFVRYIMPCSGPGIPFFGQALDRKEFKLLVEHADLTRR